MSPPLHGQQQLLAPVVQLNRLRDPLIMAENATLNKNSCLRVESGDKKANLGVGRSFFWVEDKVNVTV